MVDKLRKPQLDELLSKLNIECNDYYRLDMALTHSSFTFENKLSSLENNERLEFLGDAVLKLIASEYLHCRFPTYNEGELTKIRAILISDNVLAKIARKVDLGKYLKLGFHEDKAGGRQRSSTLACSFEALLGACYLDGKEAALKVILEKLLVDEVTEIDQNAAKHNHKAILQEYTQANNLNLPEYIMLGEEGPPHNKTFKIMVSIDGEACGFGLGKSKKTAQQNAAEVAVAKLGLLEDIPSNG